MKSLQAGGVDRSGLRTGGHEICMVSMDRAYADDDAVLVKSAIKGSESLSSNK